MELPAVPRADDVVAVERAFAQRPAGMVAHVRDRPELAVVQGEGDLRVLHGERPNAGAAQLRRRAQIDPVFVRHAADRIGAGSGQGQGLAGTLANLTILYTSGRSVSETIGHARLPA